MEQDQRQVQLEDNDLLASFDFEKFKTIFRKSWIYMVLFLGVTCVGAFMYIRYTKPLYESSSVIKLNFQSEASFLNISSSISKQDGEISGEIELLKSPLFFSKVVDAIDINVSYYKYGRFLDDERYGTNPFVVSYKINNASFYDSPFDLEILDAKRFILIYNNQQKEYNFGEDIRTNDFNLLIEKNSKFSSQTKGRYYFIINSRGSLISYLKSGVKVTPESFNAKTLRISFQSYNQRKAQVLVKTIDSIYEIYTRDAKNRVLEQKMAFLDSRLKATEEILKEYENYFQNFILEYRTISLSSDLSRTLNQLDQLDTIHYKLRKNKTEIEFLVSQLDKNEPILFNDFFIEQLPVFIKESLKNYQTLKNDRVKKIYSYSENTYIIKRLDDQIELAKTRFLASVNAYLDQLNEQLGIIASRKSILENALSLIPSLETEYSKNRRLYGQQEDFMFSLIRTKMEMEITKAGTVTNIIVLSPPTYPNAPIQPQKLLVYALGVVIGLIISVIFLLVRYLMDNKISGISELERLVHVPILGSVPFYTQEKLLTTKLVIKPDAKSSLSEALRTIRTNLEFMNGTKDRHIISITSSVSGEGKTFLAVNLGAIIAISGQRVCLVDLDMRKPKIHLAFNNADNLKGVSTILSGKTEISECIKKSDIESLDYLSAGPIPPNPSELLMGESFSELLKELENNYDTIILDSPPVGLVTDGILVMKKADLQLYVVRSGYTQRSYLKTIDLLKRTNKFDKLTVIFNSISGTSGYGYGYGYGYGHGYYEDEKKSRSFVDVIKSFF